MFEALTRSGEGGSLATIMLAYCKAGLRTTQQAVNC